METTKIIIRVQVASEQKLPITIKVAPSSRVTSRCANVYRPGSETMLDDEELPSLNDRCNPAAFGKSSSLFLQLRHCDQLLL
jgi:hypothetical protein